MSEHEEHEDHDHDHDHDHEEDVLQEALELDTQSQIFLEMRRQNLDLLKLAAEVAGFAGQHPPLKPNDIESAMKAIWRIYSDFETWIDPGDEEGDEEDEDEE